MGVTTNELLVHTAHHIVDRKLTCIARDLRVQHHLHENIAQLFAQMNRVVRLDAINRLVCLFNHVLSNRGMCLLTIPRAAVGLTQAPDGIDKILERIARLNERLDVAALRLSLRCLSHSVLLKRRHRPCDDSKNKKTARTQAKSPDASRNT